MAKYVPDVSTRRWVVISPQRLDRPDTYSKADICPFCSGHEKDTPPETFRIGSGEANGVGWKVRVVPNKFSITDVHEVVIHSPDHTKDIENLPLEHVAMILNTYKQRYNFYKKKGQVLIFCNHGLHAGGSLQHPHSQIVVIPSQINLDTLVREPINNIVEIDNMFSVYCPDFSQWPYEVWISPKNQETVFSDINDKELQGLAVILQKMLRRLLHIYQTRKISTLLFGYNYYIYPKENWYLRIIPRFVNRAGFELGTGLQVNVIDPLEAAMELKGVERKMRGVLEKLRKY